MRAAVAADGEGFWYRAGVAAVGPVISAILGGLIIGAIVQQVAQRAQERQARRNLRNALVAEVTDAAGALYMQTQMFWRMITGRVPAGKDELSAAQTRLDEQYTKSRVAGLVLENRLDVYFASDEPRQKWHRTMDFLTVRYFQVLEPDKGVTRAARLRKLYEANAKPECTGLNTEQLNSAKRVLQGYRTALREATTAILTAEFRDQASLKAAHDDSAKVAAQRVTQDEADPDAAVADDADSRQQAIAGATGSPLAPSGEGTTSGPSTTDDELPWWAGPGRYPGWAEKVDDWAWQEEVKAAPVGQPRCIGWFKTGSCPRCEHVMTVEAKLAHTLLPEAPIPETRRQKRVRCNCTSDKHKRPGGFSDGCGVVDAIDPPA
jgi:hypothetical protein